MYQTGYKNATDKQKDSSLNICTLNMRSLTISDKSIKLKRVFQMEHAFIVLTEVCVNGSKFEMLHQKISQSRIWSARFCLLSMLH